MEEQKQTINLRSSVSNKIQEQQAPCKCGRGEKVRFYCAQDNCQLHKDDVLFCDDCFRDLMQKKSPHIFLQIGHLQEDMMKRWMPLIEKEGQLAEDFAWLDSPQLKSLDAYAKNFPNIKTINFGEFDEFHNEFQQDREKFEKNTSEFDAKMLLEIDKKHAKYFKLVNEFAWIKDIDSKNIDEFIYNNYKSCLESYPIHDEFAVEILPLKVRLGKEKILAASKSEKRQYNLMQLVEEMNKVKQIVGVQQAKLDAFTSLFGHVDGAQGFIKILFEKIAELRREQTTRFEFRELRQIGQITKKELDKEYVKLEMLTLEVDEMKTQLQSLLPASERKAAQAETQDYKLQDINLFQQSDFDEFKEKIMQAITEVRLSEEEIKDFTLRVEKEFKFRDKDRSIYRTVQLQTIRHYEREDFYYGQFLNGKRDGFGYIFFFDYWPILIAGQWKKDLLIYQGCRLGVNNQYKMIFQNSEYSCCCGSILCRDHDESEYELHKFDEHSEFQRKIYKKDRSFEEGHWCHQHDNFDGDYKCYDARGNFIKYDYYECGEHEE